MTLNRQFVFWSLAIIVVVGLLITLQQILLPFLLGLLIAYLLDPVADRFESWGMPRLLAALVIVTLAGLFFFAVVIFVLPLVIDQLRDLITAMPEQLRSLQGFLERKGEEQFGDKFGDIRKSLTASIAEFSKGLTSSFGNILKSIWSSGLAIVNVLSLALITPVVAFYMLVDWDDMVKRIDSWMPREHVATVRRLASEIDDVVNGFVRGQFIVCMLLACMYTIGLQLVGLQYALLIGIIAGLFSFIPYVGVVLGLGLAMSVGLYQFWPDWISLAKIIAIFAGGQLVEGTLLSPKIVGESVKLHPVWLIFSLLAFGVLFGFVGLLVAVPAAASIGVLARYALQRYLDSPIYSGVDETTAQASTTQLPLKSETATPAATEEANTSNVSKTTSTPERPKAKRRPGRGRRRPK